MATNFDKALYAAPTGLAAIADTMPSIEVEIEIGGLDDVEDTADEEAELEFDANLAEEMPEGVLLEVIGDLMKDFQDDISSRKDWIQTYVDGLELLGMKIEERSEPWEGACGVHHPLLSEALVNFQAETIMETMPAAGPVKTQIIGKETPAKREAAERVQNDMNYQITEKMVEYRPEHERLLWGLGLSGNAFKKVYFDPALDRQTARFVPSEDVVVPYGASDLETAERVTHVMRKTKNELKRLQVAGFYRDVDLPEPANSLDEIEKKIAEQQGFRATSDNRYKILEMQVFLDLPGYEDVDEDGEPTGIALPYIVTIEKTSEIVLAIRRNWRPEDDTKQKRNHFVHYGYVPGFGFYCYGLIHLVGAFAKGSTSILRQLVDAGTLANLPGGLKAKGMRVKGDDTPIAPGEFRDVDVASGTVRDNIMTLPYKEPSQTLLALLNTIVEGGRKLASAGDLKISDMSSQSPVGTTLAILEKTLKVMSAIQARVHYAMRREFQLLRDIIRDYTPDDYDYDPDDADRRAKKSDYDMVDVLPVSDPNAATMAQKVVQYQAVIQMAQGAPQIYDLPELHRQMLTVLGIKNIGKLIPTTDDQKPRDPVFENMALMNGKPVKAFGYQDHEAHITVHMAAAQDPKIAALIGQNPMAQKIMASFAAHVTEHIAFSYRQKLEEQLGVPLPTTDDDDEGMNMTPEMETQVSRLTAAAAVKLLQANKAQQAQQQAQQTAQDPLVQMQQQELALKGREVALKEKKVTVDAAAKADQLEIEKSRIDAQLQIAGMQVGAKATKDKADLAARTQIEGVRLGSQIAHNKAQTDIQRTQATKPDKESTPT